MSKVLTILAAASLAWGLGSLGGEAQSSCAPGLAEIEGALERTILDELTAARMRAMLAAARQADASGDVQRCLDLVQELRLSLHLDH